MRDKKGSNRATVAVTEKSKVVVVMVWVVGIKNTNQQDVNSSETIIILFDRL